MNRLILLEGLPGTGTVYTREMDRDEILNCLSEFPYDRREYWVITGGVMVLYGIREQTAALIYQTCNRIAS